MTESKECEWCGKTFERSAHTSFSHWQARRYCSQLCGNRASRQQTRERFELAVRNNPDLMIEKPCGKCGQLMERPKGLSITNWAMQTVHRSCPRPPVHISTAELREYYRTEDYKSFVANCRRPKRSILFAQPA